MMTVPGLTPVTVPVVSSIVARKLLLLLHVPPVVVLESIVVASGHTDKVPPMAPGGDATVTVVVVEQLPAVVYEICAVPADMPVTVPFVALTETVACGLDQLPPPGVLVRIVAAPGQIVSVPLMGAGVGLTVIGNMAALVPQELATT
jgi:hypothetical protein